MSDEPKKYTTSNFELLDKHLELAVSREKEITKDRQSKTFWRNAKSISLVLLALGIFFIMLGYAFYLYKDDKVIEKVVTIPEKIIERQVLIDNSSTNKDNLANNNSTNNQNTNTDTKNNNTKNDKSFLQDNIITNSLYKYFPSSESSNNAVEGNRIRNVIKFSFKELTINNKTVSVVTRYHYMDTNDDKPYTQSCYFESNPYKYELSTYDKGNEKNINNDDAITKLGISNINELRDYCLYI